jgi:hypothetical protein
MIRSATTPTVVTAALAGLLLIAGCATGKTADGNPFSQELAERNEVQVQVKNYHFSDATVWVLVRDARRMRLGYVTGKTDAVFTIPWTFPEPMRLEFDLLADVRCITEELMVDPGDILELQISLDPRSDPQCR